MDPPPSYTWLRRLPDEVQNYSSILTELWMETPVFWGRPSFPRMSLMDMNFALEMSMSEERKPETPDFYFSRDRGKHIWR